MAYQQANEFVVESATSQFAPQMSPPTASHRKGSLNNGTASYVDLHQDWSDVGSEHKHGDDGVNALAMAPNAPLDSSSFKHEHSWTPHERINTFTHSSEFDSHMTDYSVHGGHGTLSMPYHQSSQANADRTSPILANGVMAPLQEPNQFPITSQGSNWATNPLTDGFDFSPLAPQGPRSTPVFATSTSILRRDGIRKKNARFEIPAERNLRTIDQLIAQTTDETEVKELKQQKRLLRNRQAALDSRQRKKQHTERLEEEKKQYTTILSEMDEELNAAKLREAEWMRQRDDLLQSNARLHQWCQQLQAEKEESLRIHTVESGQLRKENSMLLEQLQHLETTSLGAPSSAGLPTDFTEFEQLTIQSNSWEHYAFNNSSFGINASAESDTSTSSMLPKQHDTVQKEEKEHTSTVAFMLLLLGAWLVSSGTSSGSNILPSVPESLRTASATVIEGLYKDSGIALPEQEPTPPFSSTDRSESSQLPNTSLSNAIKSGAHQAHSMQDVTHNSMNTDQEMLGQAPSNNVEAIQSSTPQMSKIVRSAVRSIASSNMQRSAYSSEPYIKSLLVDKVPKHVLKDFAQLIASSRTQANPQFGLNEDQANYEI